MARKMKDSGVEWIGEIPEGWEITRLKYLADFEPTCDTSYLTDESKITYTPMECVKMAALKIVLHFMETFRIH